jgi:putative redox protein
MTSQILYLGDLRTEAEHLQSATRIITDAPTDNQGRGEAFSPTDLMATSLGCCIITIMGIKARDLGVSLDGSKVHCLKIMGMAPRRVSEIVIDLYLPAATSDYNRKVLEAAGRACPVSQSLHPDLEQTITFHWSL